jgi:hypothetical protein
MRTARGVARLPWEDGPSLAASVAGAGVRESALEIGWGGEGLLGSQDGYLGHQGVELLEEPSIFPLLRSSSPPSSIFVELFCTFWDGSLLVFLS